MKKKLTPIKMYDNLFLYLKDLQKQQACVVKTLKGYLS